MGEDGLQMLRELLADPNTPAAARERLVEALETLARADAAVKFVLSVPLPKCLEGITAEQEAAIQSMCHRASMAAAREYCKQMAIETARLAVQHHRAH